MKCDWCPPKYFKEFPACFEKYAGKSQYKNPGNINELHALARGVMPTFIDGIELDYIYRLASNKYVTSNWVLSHTRPSGFRFGGIYTMRMYNDLLQTPTIHADINPTTLASNVGIVYFPFNSLRLESSLQRAADDVPLQTHFIVELQRPFATITANLYNVRRNSGRGTLAVMRSMTQHLAVGGELLLEWTEPRSTMADAAFAMRYSKLNYSIAASFSRQGFDVSFWQKLHQRIQMATTLAFHRKTQKSIAQFGYQWNFHDAYVRAMLDSDASVGFMYYRSLNHLPCGLTMSLLISLPTNRFSFGLKFILDPSGFRRGP